MKKLDFPNSVILAFIVIFFAWLLVFNSDAYSQAQLFLKDSPEIKSEFGDIEYSFTYAANIKNSQSHFRVYIVGEKKHSSVSLHIEEKNGIWIVRRDGL